ncbi:hypothetical protein AB0C63_36745 [Streptomyces asoensis]
MDLFSRPLVDRSAAALVEGYAWLPNRMRESPGAVVRTRLLGRPAVAPRGPRQDLSIPLRRIPTRPRSGFVITDVHLPESGGAAAA